MSSRFYFITQILSGTLINANLGHSTLIYRALIKAACKSNLYENGNIKLNCVKTCKNGDNLN